MLAAMQGNTTVFPPVRSPPTSNLRPSSNPASVPTSIHYQTASPSMIPVAMVPPPPILIGPNTNYTIIPSLPGGSAENMLRNLQFNNETGEPKAPIAPTTYFTNPDHQQILATPSSSEENNRFIATAQHPDSMPIEQNSHTHIDLPSHQGTSSPVELKPPFLLAASPPTCSSTGNAMLDRGTSSSDPQLSEHHHRHAHSEGAEGHRRRRKKHSHRRRHHEIQDHPSGKGRGNFFVVLIVVLVSLCVVKLPVNR